MSHSIHAYEPRGYFGVVLWMPTRHENVSAIMRSAVVFGARFVVIAGARYIRRPADTVNGINKVCIHECGATVADVRAFLPKGCEIVAVELTEDSRAMPHFVHPVCAAYVFGPEDGDVPAFFGRSVQIPGATCLNLGTSVGITLYDRIAKRARLFRRSRVEVEVGAA